ncbi:hypothetical protein CcaCcLH18_01942 [Colletotrichum camelliae]|nr:hypothetical protein CcaCcLH18_01942 [Colletotrichum camelliae]
MIPHPHHPLPEHPTLQHKQHPPAPKHRRLPILLLNFHSLRQLLEHLTARVAPPSVRLGVRTLKLTSGTGSMLRLTKLDIVIPRGRPSRSVDVHTTTECASRRITPRSWSGSSSFMSTSFVGGVGGSVRHVDDARGGDVCIARRRSEDDVVVRPRGHCGLVGTRIWAARRQLHTEHHIEAR